MVTLTYAVDDSAGPSHGRVEAKACSSSTRWSFLFAAAYLVSQCFLIPVHALGPSWTLWPRFADFAWVGMVLLFLVGAKDSRACSREHKILFLLFGMSLGGMLLSLSAYIAFVGNKIGALDGIYAIFRFAQFGSLFVVLSYLPITDARRRMLSKACAATLVLSALGIIATYFQVITLDMLTRHLPGNQDLSGPWYDYLHLSQYPEISQGLGTISYNHAYTGVQLILLLGLRYFLSGERVTGSNAALTLLTLFAILLCESRAGLAAALVFCVTQVIQRPKVLLALLPLILIFVSYLNFELIGETLRRQQTIISFHEDDALSGRPLIWKSHIDELNREPLKWVIGGGIGSSRTYGLENNAHNMFLEVTVEFGLLGLMLFLTICCYVLFTLYRIERVPKPLFWTTVALVLSGMTQETFVPVPALGHFLGLYLFVLAIALQPSARRPASRTSSF